MKKLTLKTLLIIFCLFLSCFFNTSYINLKLDSTYPYQSIDLYENNNVISFPTIFFNNEYANIALKFKIKLLELNKKIQYNKKTFEEKFIIFFEYLASLQEQADINKILKDLILLVDTQDLELTINQVITSLLYENKRYNGRYNKRYKKYNWKNPHPYCQARRNLIDFLDKDKKFESYTEGEYSKYIQNKETEKETFFGVDLSDDSDSEEDKEIFNEKERNKVSKNEYWGGSFKEDFEDLAKNPSKIKADTKWAYQKRKLRGKYKYRFERLEYIFKEYYLTAILEKLEVLENLINKVRIFSKSQVELKDIKEKIAEILAISKKIEFKKNSESIDFLKDKILYGVETFLGKISIQVEVLSIGDVAYITL
jgi:hypothetical protein